MKIYHNVTEPTNDKITTIIRWSKNELYDFMKFQNFTEEEAFGEMAKVAYQSHRSSPGYRTVSFEEFATEQGIGIVSEKHRKIIETISANNDEQELFIFSDRQVGKTTTIIQKALYECINNRKPIDIVCYNESMRQQLSERINKQFANNYVTGINTYTISEYSNEQRWKGIPFANPSFILFDEFAHMDMDKVIKAIDLHSYGVGNKPQIIGISSPLTWGNKEWIVI